MKCTSDNQVHPFSKETDSLGKKQFPQETIPTAVYMLGPQSTTVVTDAHTHAMPTFGESGSIGAFKSFLLDPCCGIFLNAELQKIHLFKPALYPLHTNWMVYKIQTAASKSQHQELLSSKTQSFPISQPSARRPSGDISAPG